MKIFISKSWYIALIWFLIMTTLQWYTIGKQINPSTDEGVYLYSAKLLSQGYIPYKNFFLTHPPFIFSLLSVLLSLIHFNIDIFHGIYICWVLSCIFPLYYIIYRFTKNHFASSCAIILFCGYPEFQRYDVHALSLRNISLPFFAFFLLFLIQNKLKTAALLLGFFSISLISNIPFTIVFIVLYLRFFEKKLFFKPILIWIKYRSFFIIYSLICIAGYLPIFIINRGIENVIIFQLTRPSLNFPVRFYLLYTFLLNNLNIYLFGLWGIFIKDSSAKLFSLLSIFSFLIIGFLSNMFYFHYFNILALPLTISAGITIHYLTTTYLKKLAVTALLITLFFLISYPNLLYYLIQRDSHPDYQIVNYLKTMREPIFTFQPIYVLMANKDLLFDYHAADMRYYDIISPTKDLSQDRYIALIEKSNTILLENIYSKNHIKGKSLEYIQKNFDLKFKNKVGEIYERKAIVR